MQLARFFGRFLDLVFPPADTARSMRECSDEEFYALLSPQAHARGIVSLLPYRHPLVRAAIIEAKFKKNTKATGLLSEVLRDYLHARAEDLAELSSERSIIVPIPLSRERHRARGYNQIEEVAKAAGAPLATGLLIRTRDTAPQTSLSRRARLLNMEGAFRARGPVDTSCTYIVLDDVTTTGATLSAAADALIAGGAKQVSLLALAH